MLIGIAVIGIAVYVGAPTWTIVFASLGIAAKVLYSFIKLITD